MEKITQLEAYCKLIELFTEGASNKEIADLAFDFYNKWSDANSKESYDTIYDIALIDEPGMDLTHEEIKELIEKLYDIDTLIATQAKSITQDFKKFSQFISKIEEDNYLKLKHPEIYQDLMDTYSLALSDFDKEKQLFYDNWTAHQLKAFLSIKRFFSIVPYRLEPVDTVSFVPNKA